MNSSQREEITLYIETAKEMLEVAELMLDNDFYSSAINRAYYAIFYAANALLVTKGLESGKHSGVISAFRQYFVKPGLVDAEYSKIYGQALADRNESDYELDAIITKEDTQLNLVGAKKFVTEIERWLKRETWL